MQYEVSDVVRKGPEQAAQVIALRLSDGSEMTSECAIAMMTHHGATFRRRDGNRWHEFKVVHRKVWLAELEA